MKDRSYGTDNFIATVLCTLQHSSCHLGPVILRVMGWVGYHEVEFEFGHSTYAAKESVDYYEGWKTEEDDKCYVDWASVTLPTAFEDHLFNVRDAELRMGDYLRAVRTAQQMMGDGYV